LAICSRGHTAFGDEDVEVLDVELVDTLEEAELWYRRVIVEQPWVERH
jgi:hypothetical protein